MLDRFCFVVSIILFVPYFIINEIIDNYKEWESKNGN